MADINDSFGGVCQDIEKILYRRGGPIRLSRYPDAEIVCVYGQDASPLHRARHGLDHIEEMAYTAAEHHPYHRLLNGITEAARILLDEWDGTINTEDAERLQWSLANACNALDRIHTDR